MKNFRDFSGFYSLQKTLCFELKPIGRTLQNILESHLLDKDAHRADSYQIVKKIIDRYHKYYIDEILKLCSLKIESTSATDSLAEYYEFYHYNNKDEKRAPKLSKISAELRKSIVEALTKTDEYKKMFSKDLINSELIRFAKTAEEKAQVLEFKGYTTYFTGFQDNRENMYSKDEKSTAIAFRVINQNLPKFIDNLDAFDRIKNSSISENFADIELAFNEILNSAKLNEVFSLPYFNKALTQSQITAYNTLIGGITIDERHRIKGINEYVNLYNQVHPKNERLPRMKQLYKQILSEREAISFLPEEFASDSEMLQSINDFCKELSLIISDDNTSLKVLLHNLATYELSGIYVRNDKAITDISQSLFGDWSILGKAIEQDIERSNPKKPRESAEKYEERISKLIKSQSSFSIGYLDQCLKNYGKGEDVESYFANLGAIDTDDRQEVNLCVRIANAYSEAAELFAATDIGENAISQSEKDVSRIKMLLDSIKALEAFIQPLCGTGEEADKNSAFYGEFSAYWDLVSKVTPLYNKVRNRMTRKPYSAEKIKLNFDNPQLLDGWDANKERDDFGMILQKDGLYYLGILNKKSSRIFESDKLDSAGECYSKMEYKLLPGPNKMLPKVFFSKSRIDEFNPSKDILRIKEEETFKKGDKFSLDDCHKFIDFYKESINKHEDWKKFDFKFSETKSYTDISGFYREVEAQGYKITYRDISTKFIDKLVEEGKLYLFQIYNKDFSPYSKGMPNMHTLYFKELFNDENLRNVVYKLNGGAEVFFRKRSIPADRAVVHKANQSLPNKNILNDKKSSTFTYDITKDRRYTLDKFQFHVPITLNHISQNLNNINGKVNDYIRNNKDVNIIGIDRGERNLLYVTVINQKGEILEQRSLNEIVNEYKGESYITDYHSLLDKRETEHREARKSWKAMSNIKELKDGYLSQAVSKIVEMVIKYNAIVVLENLSGGFKRGRQKVEKAVYQKFEQQLISKLNYCVDKKKQKEELGGLRRAYQLTNKFESFNKVGWQSGVLFYIPAWATSKIDPVTGFYNMFDCRYESIDKARSMFSKFHSIRFNTESELFEFTFDYLDFNKKAEGTRTNWKIATYGSRIKTFRNPEKNNQWDSEEINLTDEYKKLLCEAGIDIFGNLKEAICSQTDKKFFEDLMHLFHLTVQLRNSKTGTDIDYMVSPAADVAGHYFDSRACGKELPQDADANGAYNIARKGLMVIDQINKAKDLEKIKLSLTNKEWLCYAQAFSGNNG